MNEAETSRLSEAETRAELIDPALKAAGWGIIEGSRIRREVIAPGCLIGNGKRAKADIADYVLVYRGEKLAVIEAKKRDLPDTEGLGQAKKYAEKLQTRFAYSTNGVGIYQVDMHTGIEGYINQYPTLDQLWEATFSKNNAWRDRFAAIPFEDKSGTWEARYYQHNAIKHVLEAICQGQDRILLTMATGTGKTFIAFQLAWKLFQSRWNLSRQPTHRPRILFLSDRNILANQAYIAYASPPISRRERVLARKSSIFSRYTDKQQEFIDFVLEQYIKAGVGELDRAKLPQLLELKYHTVRDAVEELGSVAKIGEVFIGFQQYLYLQDAA